MQTTFNVNVPTGGNDERVIRHSFKRMGLAPTDYVEKWERVRPRVIAWVEVNQSDAVDDAVAGLLAWSPIADAAIVTTVPGSEDSPWPGNLDIYDELCRRVPHLQFIPGLKVNAALDRFDDVKGWERIGVELADMAKRCSSNTVVLECESAVGPYGLGDEVVGWALFRKAMEHLPKDLRIIWYPGITGNNYEKQQRMWELCRVVVQVHGNITLVDRTYGRPAAVKWHWSKEARNWLESIGAPTIPMLYFYGNKKYWLDEQIHEALGHVKDAPAVIIYPGAARFKDAAIGIGKALEAGG